MPRVPHPPRPPQPFRSTSASEQRAVAAASFDSSGFRRSPPFENGRVGGWESDLRRGASELELCVFFGVLRGGFAAVSAAPLSFPFGVQSSVTLVEEVLMIPSLLGRRGFCRRLWRSQFFEWLLKIGKSPRPIPVTGHTVPLIPEVGQLSQHSADPPAGVAQSKASIFLAKKSWAIMVHTKSDSDVTSLAPSSPPRSPKRPVYYVQSPSRDSHDGDKSSSMQATPVYNSPMESPSHPSFGRHSRASSASRFSGAFRSSSGRKTNRKRNDKGWPECNVIQEEGSYDDLDEDGGLSRRCQVVLAFVCFVLLFTVFCLIIWGASRPYKPDVVVKSLVVDDFYYGEGSDNTGVPTKMITVNCSLKISVYNPAPTFGIHVSSSAVNLVYSQITVATGEASYIFSINSFDSIAELVLFSISCDAEPRSFSG
ncbi:hypothetical protein Taro_024346 [Colocasia esculenta]|uniref:Late embryogenesis abundant protein LEA-2 subgroup domain-containing protein n=1 Tax=Colocasia esculenta TaxID=4460 RepID=A0A843V771_COLES|nr:hypothetical protein [Colocasia esculenta]